MDNLLSSQVVTADGKMLNASASENNDLFWTAGAFFLFRVCRDFFRGDAERGGQRAVRADGTRPIKSQRFLFHQRQR
jgi:hypothetical protein